MAVHLPVESDLSERVLQPAAEALRTLAHFVGILAAGLLAGFLARGFGGGILIDGVALSVPAVLIASAAFLVYRALRAHGPFRRGNSASAP